MFNAYTPRGQLRGKLTVLWRGVASVLRLLHCEGRKAYVWVPASLPTRLTELLKVFEKPLQTRDWMVNTRPAGGVKEGVEKPL